MSFSIIIFLLVQLQIKTKRITKIMKRSRITVKGQVKRRITILSTSSFHISSNMRAWNLTFPWERGLRFFAERNTTICATQKFSHFTAHFLFQNWILAFAFFYLKNRTKKHDENLKNKRSFESFQRNNYFHYFYSCTPLYC